MIRGGEERSITKITVAALLGLNVLVFGGLALAGVPLLPSGAEAATAEDSEARYVPLADSQDVPAYRVVRSVLDGPIDGARPAGEVWASSGSPFDKACPDTKDPSPVVSYARPFRAAGGVVSVRVSAYGAGQGAAALLALVDRLDTCPNTGTTGAAVGPASTAVTAWSQSTATNATVLLWNRSDVVASVTVPRTSPIGLAAVAKSVDKALVEALDGTCASEDVTSSDAGRSPWSGVPFTGNLQPRPIELSYPNPSTSPTPVLPSDVPTVSVPAPTIPVPDLATVPPGVVLDQQDAPAQPVATPQGTDGPVVQLAGPPAVPVVPSAPPTVVEVDEQVDDPTGPGCGWAFTMQGAPPFDSEAAATQFQLNAEEARIQLLQADSTWQSERATYALQYKQYAAEAEAFANYAREYNSYVSRASGAAYDELLAIYLAALDARDTFDGERAQAQAEYENAIQECVLAGSPTPTFEPTPTSDPQETLFPTPEPTDVVACPPPVPPILTQPRPAVPERPERP